MRPLSTRRIRPGPTKRLEQETAWARERVNLPTQIDAFNQAVNLANVFRRLAISQLFQPLQILLGDLEIGVQFDRGLDFSAGLIFAPQLFQDKTQTPVRPGEGRLAAFRRLAEVL